MRSSDATLGPQRWSYFILITYDMTNHFQRFWRDDYRVFWFKEPMVSSGSLLELGHWTWSYMHQYFTTTLLSQRKSEVIQLVCPYWACRDSLVFPTGSLVPLFSSHQHYPLFNSLSIHVISYSHSFISWGHPSPHLSLGNVVSLAHHQWIVSEIWKK